MSCRSTRFWKVMCIRGEGVFRFYWQAKSRLTSWGASISATCRVSVYKFIHTLIRGVAMFHLCWLVHSFGSDWNISTTIAWVVMKFGTDFVANRMNPVDFYDPLTFPVSLPSGQNLRNITSSEHAGYSVQRQRETERKTCTAPKIKKFNVAMLILRRAAANRLN